MARLLRGLFLIAAFLFSSFVAAASSDSRVAYTEIVLAEDGYALNADFDFVLSPKLTDALKHGVALHFVAEVRIERPRWYWFNKKIVDRRLNYRLSYHAITRRYRLNIGSLHLSYDNLEDAARTMQRLRNWHVAPAKDLTKDIPYTVELRFRHDTAQLPKPFQLSAVAGGEWKVDTDWLKWVFLPEMAKVR
ncbi:MAG: DUF4390 domain-containing protein [Azoarcus sp.]|jgi:uncharacterized protein YqcC (DUF446 family)|nr:DUF4390 domain-containing protein [Azoarcus sp.]